MLRRADVADLTAIMRIARKGFTGDDRFGLVYLVKLLAMPGTECWVEDAGVGVVRGFILIQKFAAGTIVRLIATDPGCRKQGVGKTLLSVVKAPAGAWVRVENEASRTLFARDGWTVSVPTWAEPKRPTKHTGDWVFFLKGA